MSISNRALLVNMSISQWTGRKYDRQATDTVEASHATDRGVGNYTKKLLPQAKELDAIQRAASSMRKFFYEQTLPWCSDGTRILASKNYMRFTEAYRQRKAEFDFAVRELIAQYPTLKGEAEAKLGGLFREGEYPTQAALQHAFGCDVAFMPMPDVGDFRTAISDDEKRTFEKRMQDVQANALRECWTRLHDVVSKAAERLSDPNAVFRDSLLENVKEMCELLPMLNVTEDSDLEAMRKQVEATVRSTDAEACRSSVTERETAARALASAMSKMGAFMGGSK